MFINKVHRIFALCVLMVLCHGSPLQINEIGGVEYDFDDNSFGWSDEVNDMEYDEYEYEYDEGNSDDDDEDDEGDADDDDEDDKENADDDDKDDEYEETEIALANGKIEEFLNKPNKTEKELLDVFVIIFHSLKDLIASEPENSGTSKSIDNFLKNPNKEDLFVMIKDPAIFNNDKDSDYQELVREVENIGSHRKDNSSEKVDPYITDNITDALKYLFDPEIPKAIDATKKLNDLKLELKNETIVKKNEISFMNMRSRLQVTKGLRKKHLRKQIKRELETLVKKHEKLEEVYENILDCVENEKKKQAVFAMISETDDGFSKAIFFYYKKRDDGKYNMKKIRLEGKLELSASLVVTRVATSNSTFSESKDVINYIPKDGAEDVDVKRLLMSMVPDLSKLLSKFTSKW